MGRAQGAGQQLWGWDRRCCPCEGDAEGDTVTVEGGWKWEGTSGSHLMKDTISFFVSHTAGSWSPWCPAGHPGPFFLAASLRVPPAHPRTGILLG